MSTEDKSSAAAGEESLLPWDECNVFCIHDYSGTGASPCGWRGLLQDARRDASGARILCPRCGSATLLRLPTDRTNRAKA